MDSAVVRNAIGSLNKLSGGAKDALFDIESGQSHLSQAGWRSLSRPATGAQPPNTRRCSRFTASSATRRSCRQAPRRNGGRPSKPGPVGLIIVRGPRPFERTECFEEILALRPVLLAVTAAQAGERARPPKSAVASEPAGCLTHRQGGPMAPKTDRPRRVRSAVERMRLYRQRRRQQLRSIRVVLTDDQIGGLVRLGYLGIRMRYLARSDGPGRGGP